MNRGDNKLEDFKLKSPCLHLPILQEGSFVLNEASAILGFMAVDNKVEEWYPPEPKKRSEVDRIFSWCHSNFYTPIGLLLYNDYFGPQRGKPWDEDLSFDCRKKINEMLAIL